MKYKVDFLKECMSDPALVSAQIPIDEFNKAYCLLCANRECSRSASNNMAFDKRAQNWESDLFINVPRARSDDPNFIHIRSKFFAPVTPGLEIRGNNGFVPLETKSVTKEVVGKPVEVAENDGALPEETNIQKTEEHIEKPQETVTPIQKPPLSNVFEGNTVFSQGIILSDEKPDEKKEEVIILGSDSSFTFGDE